MRLSERTTQWPAILPPLLLLSACSSYGGQKLGVDPATHAAVPPTGLPYTLVRPEYSVTTTPPAAGDADGKTTYTLTVSYQPDPRQQFSLRTRPGFLADPDFTLNFGAGGTLTGAKTSVTEQFTPWVKAIGSFAGNLAALGVFDETKVKEDLIQRVTNEAACQGPAGSAWLDGDTLRLVSRSAKDAIVQRLKAYDKEETIAKRLHYASQAELRCFKAIRDPLQAQWQATLDTKKSGFTAAEATFSGDEEFEKKISGLVAKKDQEGFKREKEALLALQGPNPALAARRQPFMAAADAYMSAMTTSPLQDLLTSVVEMNAATWRARHLLHLEDEIAAAQLALLRHPDASHADRQRVGDHVVALQRARAETIGASDLYARSLSLRGFLSRVPPAGTSGRISGATEYTTARAELDVVSERIEALRTKVLAAAKPPEPKPPKALKDEQIFAVSRETIDSSLLPGWDRKITGPDGTRIDAPALVLVLEPIP